jgi:hypothetical protein
LTKKITGNLKINLNVRFALNEYHRKAVIKLAASLAAEQQKGHAWLALPVSVFSPWGMPIVAA